MGTELGLARFDGVRFTVFDRRHNPGLAANYIQRLLASRDGSLWIGTSNGLTHFLKGAFRTYTTRDGLSNDGVSALCEGRDGSLWVGTGQGLNRLRNGKVRVFQAADGLPDDSVKAVLEDRAGVLWVATEGGLARLDGDRFTAYTSRDGLPGGPVTALAATPDGALWAGTSHGGLARLEKRQVFGLVPGTPQPGNPVRAQRPGRQSVDRIRGWWSCGMPPSPASANRKVWRPTWCGAAWRTRMAASGWAPTMAT